VIAGLPVDQLSENVHVAGMPGDVLDHVDEHPAHRHRLAGPRRPDVLQAHLIDHDIGRGTGTPVIGDDVGGGFVRQNHPYSTDARCLTRPMRFVPDGTRWITGQR
jgi:hypothetical protein